MNANKKKIYTIICAILSFAFPALILYLAYYSLGIYRGGTHEVLILDLKAQQISFYNYFNNSSYGYNNFEYQTLGGLGGNAINPLQMCCGIFSKLFSFVSLDEIPNAIRWLIIILIGFSGLFEYLYLKKGYPALGNSILAVMFSTLYALSACAVIYTIVPVWLCGVSLLPLIILGVDRIVDDSKGCIFVVCSALAIILNYYTAYMIAVFSILYFTYRLILFDRNSVHYLKKIKSFVLYGLTAVFASAFSWIPVVIDLANGKMHENRRIYPWLIRNPVYVLLSFFPFQYDGLNKHSLPFLFCGTISLILFVIYFFCREISKRERILSGFLAFIFLLSFSIGIFDISWMFFSEPNGYPSRYSFIFSFFVILLAAKCGDRILLAVSRKCIHVMLLACFIAFSCLESYANTFHLIGSLNKDVGPYADGEEYIRVTDTMEYIINSVSNPFDMKRIVKNWRYTNNDGVFLGYRDIDYSSSGYNFRFQAFMESLGLNGQYHLLRSSGITPFVASAFGVSYFIQYDESLADNYSYIGSYNDLDVYYNELALPLAYSIDGDYTSEYSSFSDNPFENINSFVFELCGIEGVFEEVPVVWDENTFSVFAEAGKQLWMYALPSNVISSDIHGLEETDHYIYFNGVPMCEYANSISPYCVELGIGNGNYVEFEFEENDVPQYVYIASYDSEKAVTALRILADESAESVCASEEGIDFYIHKEHPGDVLITLPYDHGYEILIDGIKAKYYDYRKSLLLIPVEEGEHNIRIRYHAPGLRLGVAVSLITIALCVFRIIRKNISKETD